MQSLCFINTYLYIKAHTFDIYWIVVGVSTGKRMENGSRERKGKVVEEGERNQWKEYEWKSKSSAMSTETINPEMMV